MHDNKCAGQQWAGWPREKKGFTSNRMLYTKEGTAVPQKGILVMVDLI